jgi:phosphatidylglycerophosphate synthase
VDECFWPSLRGPARYYRALAGAFAHQSECSHIHGARSQHLGRDLVRLCNCWHTAPLVFRGRPDLVDGQVARATNRVTRFGAFFDSVVDRYSDASQFLGLLVFYARGDKFFYVVLTAFVMVSAIMVSYTRARAESLIGSCRVGFMERPERLVLVIIGALFNRMAPVLWVIAVLSTLTVIHRMRYTWTRTQDSPPTAKAGQAA